MKKDLPKASLIPAFFFQNRHRSLCKKVFPSPPARDQFISHPYAFQLFAYLLGANKKNTHETGETRRWEYVWFAARVGQPWRGYFSLHEIQRDMRD